ncbi:MAG: glycoside hydrolase family 3 C-terminal domain-containing protein, partial [Spirochaetales bacterium]|nr:glycoside hydrolase family 3 C-terminal domain-containing protein [Spirochaetales bacterium]
MNLLEHERKHLEMLRPALAECTVLLRNSGTFPLDGPCRIAAFGNGVRRTVKGGKGSGEVNSRYFINVEKGLEDAGFSITTKAWLDAYDRICDEAHAAFIRKIKAEARAHHQLAVSYSMGKTMSEPEYDLELDTTADACIYVLARDSGEGNDRKPCKGDVLLSDSERRDILELADTYKKFMLVINSGAPIDLSGLESVKDILILSQLGVETGSALSDILLGKQNPSGKLAT